MNKLTGEQVHAGYNAVLHAEAKLQKQKVTSSTIHLWSELSPTEQRMYNGLAAYLNRVLEMQEQEGEGKP